MQKNKYKLTIAYDGTNYSGWQIQKEKKTIQDIIQKALKKLLQENINLIGAGRTDTKVHALNQVAHFTCSKILDFKKFLHSLNCILPLDIRILDIKKVRYFCLHYSIYVIYL